MKHVLVISSKNLHPHVQRLNIELDDINLINDNREDILAEGISSYFQRRLFELEHSTFDAVVGITDFAAVLAGALSNKAGKISPSMQSLFNYHNKLASRYLQKKALPNHVPDFFHIPLDAVSNDVLPISLPFIIKPVTSQMSEGASVVYRSDDLNHAIQMAQSSPMTFYKDYAQLIKTSEMHESIDSTNKDLLCESFMTGTQVTVDGFVYNHEVTQVAITMSDILPGTLSFSQFTCPHQFNATIQRKIKTITKSLIKILGLNQTAFNIEYIVDEIKQQVYIVEINPRISPQFIPLIEAATGINTLKASCEIALGYHPQIEPFISTSKVGRIFILRRKHNAKVIQVASQADIEKLEVTYPGLKINLLVPAGKTLSDIAQDQYTFRYGEIYVSGQNLDDLAHTHFKVQQVLERSFIFEDIQHTARS